VTDRDPRAIAAAQLAHVSHTLRSGVRQEPGPADADPITFLRKYSNYLAPRPGLFSADTWTIGFIWLRNVLLNQLILVPAIAALVAATLLLVLITQRPAPFYSETLGLNVVRSGLALVFLVIAIAMMVRELRTITQRASARSGTVLRVPAPERDKRAGDGTAVVSLVFATLLLIGTGSFVVHAYTRLVVIGVFVVLMAAIQFAGSYVACHRRTHEDSLIAVWDVCWMAVVTGALAGWLVTLVWDLNNSRMLETPYLQLAFGPPLVGVCLVASVMLLVGLMGADYPDAAREWTARTGASLAIATAGWLTWFVLAAFGPWMVTIAFSASNVTAAAGVVAWVATTAGGVLAGRSAKTSDGGSGGAASKAARAAGGRRPDGISCRVHHRDRSSCACLRADDGPGADGACNRVRPEWSDDRHYHAA
jgi:hypothetical protein